MKNKNKKYIKKFNNKINNINKQNPNYKNNNKSKKYNIYKYNQVNNKMPIKIKIKNMKKILQLKNKRNKRK